MHLAVHIQVPSFDVPVQFTCSFVNWVVYLSISDVRNLCISLSDIYSLSRNFKF